MARDRRPSDIVQYKVRMPAHLHAKLEKEAAKYSRTLNDEIVRRLADSVDPSARVLLIRDTVASTVDLIATGKYPALKDKGDKS